MSEFWKGWMSFWNSECLGQIAAALAGMAILAIVVFGGMGILMAWEKGWRPFNKNRKGVGSGTKG
jgi:hypothetical protein